MIKIVTIAMAALAMTVSVSTAQQQAVERPRPTVPGANSTCARPSAPAFPATAISLTTEQLSTARRQRDAYFSTADAYLTCVNIEIENRMRALFASGAATDPVMDALGKVHSDVSKERATVFERFVRLCMAWEDSRQAYGVGRCTET